MISILCPTRNRPSELARMVTSVQNTVSSLKKVELLFYVDDDDILSIPAITELQDTIKGLTLKYRQGPRITLTQCWNELLPDVDGDLVMQGNDDIIFRTGSWDVMVEDKFKASTDKILLVHGSDDGMHFGNFAPHGIVHKRWVDAVGYFIPPYFSSDYGDKWLNDVANELGRRVYLPFIVEHLHFLFGKAAKDRTTLDRLERHAQDDVDNVWLLLEPKRASDVKKLRQLLDPEETKLYPIRTGTGVSTVSDVVMDDKVRCRWCNSDCVVEFSNIRRCNSCGKQDRLRW